MSSKIELIISAVDQASGTIRAFEGKMAGVAKNIERAWSGIANIPNIIMGAGLFTLAKGFVNAAMAEEKAEAKLTAAIGHHSDALVTNAKNLMLKSAFDKSDIMDAEARLGMFIREESAIKKLMPAVMDLAAAKNIDLASASELVRKGITGGTDALSRHGIHLRGTAGSAERLKSVIEELTKAFGGQSDALAQTTTGKLQNYMNQIEDLKEELGMRLIPVLIKVSELVLVIADGFNQMVYGIGSGAANLPETTKKLAAIGDETIRLNAAIDDMTKSGVRLANFPTTDGLPAIKTYDELIARREELMRQSREIMAENRKAASKGFHLKTDLKNAAPDKGETGVVWAPITTLGESAKVLSMRKLLEASKIDAQAFKYQSDQQRKIEELMAESGEVQIEINASNERIKTLDLQIQSEERTKIRRKEAEDAFGTMYNLGRALDDLAMSAVANSKRSARSKRDKMLGLAIINAALSATAAIEAGMTSSGPIWTRIAKAAAGVIAVGAMTIPEISRIQRQSFATGTTFAPGGMAKVHQDETIYLPRGSRVTPARESSSPVNMNVNFNAAVDDESLPKIKQELRTLGEKIKQGFRTGMIRANFGVVHVPGFLGYNTK